MAFKIESLTAWIAVNPENGDEGIIAHRMEDTWMPLIGADKDRLISLKRYAEHYQRDHPGVTVKLIRFSHREEVE